MNVPRLLSDAQILDLRKIADILCARLRKVQRRTLSKAYAELAFLRPDLARGSRDLSFDFHLACVLAILATRRWKAAGLTYDEMRGQIDALLGSLKKSEEPRAPKILSLGLCSERAGELLVVLRCGSC